MGTVWWVTGVSEKVLTVCDTFRKRPTVPKFPVIVSTPNSTVNSGLSQYLTLKKVNTCLVPRDRLDTRRTPTSDVNFVGRTPLNLQ